MDYLVKPVDARQVVPQIRAVRARNTDLSQLKTTETQRSQALAAERHISIASGILMERQQLGVTDAYELLRGKSRSSRRRLSEVAKEIVASAEAMNVPVNEGKK